MARFAVRGALAYDSPALTMPIHREEGRFVIRFELSAEFGDDYEGDDDGNAWLEAWRSSVQPRLVRAVFDTLRQDGRFDAVPTSRGKHPDDELEILVRWRGRPR